MPDAEDAIQKALASMPGNPSTIFHMAMVLEKKGLENEALELAAPLLERMSEMDPDTYREVRKLVVRLRGES